MTVRYGAFLFDRLCIILQCGVLCVLVLASLSVFCPLPSVNRPHSLPRDITLTPNTSTPTVSLRCVYSVVMLLCVPAGPSLHPQPSDYSSQDNLEAYYHRLREEHINNKMGGAGGSGPYPLLLPGPPPPPPELQPIIDKMAEYVARNSEDFERTVLEKHVTDPKFGFLNPWNKFYPYYKWRLRQNKERATEQALAAIEHDYQQQRAKEETLRGEKIQKLSQSGAVSFKLQPKKVTKVMDSATVDLGHAPEDEEEEQKEEQYNTAVETGESYVPQQVNYQTMQQAGYTTIEQDDSQIMLDMTNYHHDNAMRLHPQSYPEEHVHYSSEGMYYCPTSNGEVQGEDGDESLPASKRPKTAAADENTVVMDNKVQVLY